VVPVLASLLVVVVLLAGSLALRGARAPSAQLPDGSPSALDLVFAVFGENADHIYRAPAHDPSQRTLVDTVPHAPGWGILPATQMAGSLVAFTVLPADGPARGDAPAEVWLLDVDSRDRIRLAGDADLLIAPVLAAGGAELVYRRTLEGNRQALVRVDLATRLRTEVHSEETAFGIWPVGFDASGALLFARLSTAGTDLYRLEPGTGPQWLLHASDNIARDWRVSPDGRSVSFLAPELLHERVLHRAQVVSLDGVPLALAAPRDEMGEQYGPAWLPDGRGVTVGQEALAGSSPAAVIGLDGRVANLARPPRGFDVPLAWSTDARFLAVRAFDGQNSYAPGSETLVIVGADGTRRAVPAAAEVIFIGWIGRA
jgi:hypothetical protein